MAYSFRITEEYCVLAVELEQAGYFWQPRAGDWVLDRDDSSVGMLTLPITDQATVRRLNYHLPTYVQVNEMLDRMVVKFVSSGGAIVASLGERELARFDAAHFQAEEAACRLKALVAAFRAGSA
ncbi:MAG: hypothetical protein HUU03_01720 [Planctomycetaceae bacterium]|nr:hypothetical protein [Planctomycetaceae bacterium]GIK51967.1 MAG: hypothetical protein BroJett014_09400 [Planctomycetota bacterium]HRJ77925.1 hypothetical protein [Planctomycetota bacterium]